MKKILSLLSIIFIFAACKDEKIDKIVANSVCDTPNDPVVYLEATDYEVDIQYTDNSKTDFKMVPLNANALLRLDYKTSDKQAVELFGCGLPAEFRKSGLRVKVSGESILDKSHHLITPESGVAICGGYIPFAIKKIERL